MFYEFPLFSYYYGIYRVSLLKFVQKDAFADY